jgi:hypothetical protein
MAVTPLARPASRNWHFDFFFVFLPLFDVVALNLGALVDGALRVEHETKSAAAFGLGLVRT